MPTRWNIRSVVAAYRTLNAFIEDYDEDVKAGRNHGTNVGYIDEDFRSGIYFGLGLCLLVFSMVPSRISLVGLVSSLNDALARSLKTPVSSQICSVTKAIGLKH